MEGWICSRCGTSHAPWVAQCDCRSALVTTLDHVTHCAHVFDYTLTMPRCLRCGEPAPACVPCTIAVTGSPSPGNVCTAEKG